MRHILIILALLMVIAATFCAILFVEEPALSHGAGHSSIEGMKTGGDGAARMQGIGILASLFHAAAIVLCAALMALGVAPRRRTPAFWMGLGGITVACLFVWWRLLHGYTHFLDTGEVRYFLGFPGPTAWTVYGVWGTTVLFSVLYVAGFRRFIYTREDEEAFKELVQSVREEREGA